MIRDWAETDLPKTDQMSDLAGDSESMVPAVVSTSVNMYRDATHMGQLLLRSLVTLEGGCSFGTQVQPLMNFEVFNTGLLSDDRHFEVSSTGLLPDDRPIRIQQALDYTLGGTMWNIVNATASFLTHERRLVIHLRDLCRVRKIDLHALHFKRLSPIPTRLIEWLPKYHIGMTCMSRAFVAHSSTISHRMRRIFLEAYETTFARERPTKLGERVGVEAWCERHAS